MALRTGLDFASGSGFIAFMGNLGDGVLGILFEIELHKNLEMAHCLWSSPGSPWWSPNYDVALSHLSVRLMVFYYNFINCIKLCHKNTSFEIKGSSFHMLLYRHEPMN